LTLARLAGGLGDRLVEPDKLHFYRLTEHDVAGLGALPGDLPCLLTFTFL
jgi:hypothetical protein